MFHVGGIHFRLFGTGGAILFFGAGPAALLLSVLKKEPQAAGTENARLGPLSLPASR